MPFFWLCARAVGNSCLFLLVNGGSRDVVCGPQNAQGDFEGTDGWCCAGARFCQGVLVGVGFGLVRCHFCFFELGS